MYFYGTALYYATDCIKQTKNKFSIVIHDLYRKSVICIQVWVCVCLIVLSIVVL